MSSPVKLAVVTGGHTYDVIAFEHVFRAMDGIDFYVQSLDDFTASPETAAEYDVVLFYTMHRFPPGQELPWYQKNLFSTLETLGRTPQGIVLLHHSLVAFLDWPLWSELVGVEDRSITYHFGEEVTTQVATPSHPITAGLESWTMTDETYTMREPGGDSEVLLTTDNPKSGKVLAWARMFGQSRVFCYQAGHDASAFANPNFRRILERGIGWAAGRL